MKLVNRRRLTRRDVLKKTGAAASGLAIGSVLETTRYLVSAAPATELKIGVLLPYTGVFALLGEVITAGMRVGFGEVGNRAAGRPIRLVIEDSEGRPDTTLQKARKLVEQDRVDLVAGIVNSASALAARDYFHENQKLVLLATAGAVALNRNRRSPYIFRTALNNWQPDWPLGGWTYQNVAKRVLVCAPDYAAGHEHAGAFMHGFRAAGGTLIGSPVWTPFPSMGDPAPFMSAIRAARPEAIYVTHFGAESVVIVKALHEFGLTGQVPIVTTGFVVGEHVLPAQGRAALGIYNTLHWSADLDTPQNKAFVTRYRSMASREPDGYSVHGYWTARSIVEVVRATQGDVSDTQRLIRAFESIQFEGPGGRVRMDPRTHQIISKIYARQVREVNNALTNVTVKDLGEVIDPGDESKGPVRR